MRAEEKGRATGAGRDPNMHMHERPPPLLKAQVGGGSPAPLPSLLLLLPPPVTSLLSLPQSPGVTFPPASTSRSPRLPEATTTAAPSPLRAPAPALSLASLTGLTQTIWRRYKARPPAAGTRTRLSGNGSTVSLLLTPPLALFLALGLYALPSARLAKAELSAARSPVPGGCACAFPALPAGSCSVVLGEGP